MSSFAVTEDRSRSNDAPSYQTLEAGELSLGQKAQSHWSSLKWIYVISDLCFLVLSGLFGYLALVAARFAFFNSSTPLGSGQFAPRQAAAFFLIYGALVLLMSGSQKLYVVPRARPARREIILIGRSVLIALTLVMICLYLLQAPVALGLGLVLVGILSFATLASWREIRESILRRRVKQGVDAARVLIVGMGKVGRELGSYFDTSKHLGYVVVGFLDDNHHSDSQVLGKPEDLINVTRQHFVDEVFLTTPAAGELIRKLSSEAGRAQINLSLVSAPHDGIVATASITRLDSYPVIELHRRRSQVFGLTMKRGMDILLASALLIVLIPVIFAVAMAIKLDSEGPVFYWSRRLRRKGRVFNCCKFRTMVSDANAMRKHLAHLNEREKILFKICEDPRITRLGKFLRKYSFDELPQLWNVLVGDMSLVGPRPPLPEEFEQYSLEVRQRLRMKPGITGLWQVTARQDPSFERYVKLDLQYVESWSLWMDVKILVKTIPAVIRGTGS